MRGRKPLPDAIKALKGNPGKRKLHLDHGASGDPVKLQKPTYLKSARETEIFKRVSEELNRIRFIKTTDLDVLGRWCFYMAKWVNLKERVNQKDVDVYYETESKHGTMLRTHPIFASLLQIERMLMALEDRIGLNPSARQTMMRGLINAPNLPAGDLFATTKDKDLSPVAAPDSARPSAINYLARTH